LELEEALKKNDLLDFDRVMSMPETRTVKHAIPERKTGTFSFDQEGKTVCAYLKRHFLLSFWKYFQERIRFASKKTAFDEFSNILAFHQAGLPTMIPVAAGKRAGKVIGSESFLITKGIKDCVTLETYAESCLKTKTFTEKTELIKKTALLSRKMHQRGFNHRDFYLCHLLIGTEENNRDELFIVDLHRVDIRKKVPERWIIKDLAALNYSAKSKNITRTDKLRFLKYYLSIGKISKQDKLFVLKIIKKTNKMMKHAG
jgi:heptose I phosphotransferase